MGLASGPMSQNEIIEEYKSDALSQHENLESQNFEAVSETEPYGIITSPDPQYSENCEIMFPPSGNIFPADIELAFAQKDFVATPAADDEQVIIDQEVFQSA